MDLRTIWYSAEQIALKFSKQEFLIKTAELLIKILHTIILFVLCVCIFTYLVFESCYKMIRDKAKTKVEEDEPMEHEPLPYKIKGKHELDGDPEFVKRLRDKGI
jgi:hypothetical protein